MTVRAPTLATGAVVTHLLHGASLTAALRYLPLKTQAGSTWGFQGVVDATGAV
jgi:hypothetical protein